MGPNTLSPAQIRDSIGKSLEELKVERLDMLFIHVPDRETDLEDTLRAIDEEYKAGKFKNFGVSNYSEAEVGEILKICGEKGYVKPSVYQGHYNAVVRGGEKGLMRVVRREGMGFWAFRYV